MSDRESEGGNNQCLSPLFPQQAYEPLDCGRFMSRMASTNRDPAFQAVEWAISTGVKDSQ